MLHTRFCRAAQKTLKTKFYKQILALCGELLPAIYLFHLWRHLFLYIKYDGSDC